MTGASFARVVSTGTRHPRWHDSLAYGAAGIALAHVEAARAGTGDWTTAHRWVSAMAEHPISGQPDDASLYRGVPAVAFVLLTAGLPAYREALERLDRSVAAITRSCLERAHQRIDRRELPALREFDLINGLTGLGAYLLAARGDDEVTREVLTYLARLTEPIGVSGHELPGWWTGNSPADRRDPRWIGGHGNQGIAHGIAGPLALMSFALIGGIEVPGQRRAISRVTGWYHRWRCGRPRERWWPGIISRPEHDANTINQSGPQRPSWCYGTPGTVRALQVAAIALGDHDAQARAENVLADCIAESSQLLKLTDSSLCHGWTGLLETTRQVAFDAEPASPLAAMLPDFDRRVRRRVDQLDEPDREGFLEGRAGVDLALNARTPAWATCLLLTS